MGYEKNNCEDEEEEEDEDGDTSNDSEDEDSDNIYIQISMLSKLLELAMSTLNSEDDVVVAESLTTLKSIDRCYKSLDLPK